MADAKLSALTGITTPVASDILYLVNDPAGTPLDRKITLTNLAAFFAGLAVFTGAFDPINAASSAITTHVGIRRIGAAAVI